MQTGGRGGEEQREHSTFFLALMTNWVNPGNAGKYCRFYSRKKKLLSDNVPVVTAQKPTNYSERRREWGQKLHKYEWESYLKHSRNVAGWGEHYSQRNTV